MKTSRAITWARLRVLFATLLLVLFATGGLAAYASFFADRQGSHSRTELRVLGATLMSLAVFGAALAAWLKRRLWQDE